MKFSIEKHNKALLDILEIEQISQIELAKKIGVSKQAISPVYNMKRPISKRIAFYIIKFHPEIAAKYSIKLEESKTLVFDVNDPSHAISKNRIEQLEETVETLNKNIENLKSEISKIKGDLRSKGGTQ